MKRYIYSSEENVAETNFEQFVHDIASRYRASLDIRLVGKKRFYLSLLSYSDYRIYRGNVQLDDQGAYIQIPSPFSSSGYSVPNTSEDYNKLESKLVSEFEYMKQQIDAVVKAENRLPVVRKHVDEFIKYFTDINPSLSLSIDLDVYVPDYSKLSLLDKQGNRFGLCIECMVFIKIRKTKDTALYKIPYSEFRNFNRLSNKLFDYIKEYLPDERSEFEDVQDILEPKYNKGLEVPDQFIDALDYACWKNNLTYDLQESYIEFSEIDEYAISEIGDDYKEFVFTFTLDTEEFFDLQWEFWKSSRTLKQFNDKCARYLSDIAR